MVSQPSYAERVAMTLRAACGRLASDVIDRTKRTHCVSVCRGEVIDIKAYLIAVAPRCVKIYTVAQCQVNSMSGVVRCTGQ